MKRFLSLFTVLIFSGMLAFAQTRTVSGTVIDQDGNRVPFATITESGTNNVVVADGSGSFQIKLTGTKGVTVSAVGYNSADAVVSGNNVTVAIARGQGELQEVVVTALGIQRQRKDLGYSTAKVGNEELTQSSPVNLATGLQGKVSGLNVTSLNSGVFDDVKINLRGIRSLTGNNNPMLLLDGVQTNINFLSSINPQDIQDVNVLKGPTAAAIYGPDARNGVIVVTTKKGGNKGTPVVTLSQTTQFSNISFFPEMQTEFGSGGYGNYIPYENWSWGPRYDGSIVQVGRPLEDGSVQTLKYSPTNDRREFFNTGVTNQTDISLGVKDFYMSIQDARVKGIVPQDENRRTGIRLNSGKEYGKFKLGVNVNYIQQNYDVFDDVQMADYNFAQNVGLNQGLMNLIFNTPAHIPINSYSDFKTNPWATYDGYFNDYGNNPYIALDNWRRTGKTEDILTNLDMVFKATNDLSFTWRLGGSFRNANSEARSKGQTPSPYSALVRSFKIIPGSVAEGFSHSARLSSELFGNYTKNVRDFKFNVIAGTYVRQDDRKTTNVSAANLVVPELYTVSNRTGELGGASFKSRARMTSIYGAVGIGYKGWANVEFTGRNDWTSVLATGLNSFFYPGVNASVVFSDLFPQIKNGNIFSYLKLRGAWTKTGNADIAPYQLASTFSQLSGFPYGTLPGYSADDVAYDPLLEPEFTNSKEVGLELGFLKNRIILEATYYNEKSTGQIIPAAVSDATGYTSAYVNAGAFNNKGVEVDLRLSPLIKLGSAQINFKGNLSYNTSEVLDIYPGLDRLFVGGYTTAANYALVGSPAFVFLASDYIRDSLGRVIVDRETGYPSADPDLKQYGRTSPVWILGLSPSVSWKNFTFAAVAEYRGGHQAYANIASAMAWTGVSAVTAQNNRERFIFPNSSYDDGTGKFVENTDVQVIDVNDFYTGVYREVNSNFLINAASWRIREVSLSYEFPKRLLGKQNLVKGLSFTLNARNVALFVPKSNQFTDPDFNFSTGNTTGVSNSSINPPTRVIGANVTVTF